MKSFVIKYWRISLVFMILMFVVLFGLGSWSSNLFPATSKNIHDWFMKPIANATIGDVCLLGILLYLIIKPTK